jgi:predicted transcriptional regulator
MSERIIHIHIETAAETKNRLIAVARRLDKAERTFFGEHVSFTTYEQFIAALSDKRMELLSALKKLGPSSIRALSKAVARDYKSVHGDVGRLMEIGLIEKREDGLIEAPFDKIVSEIRLKAA